MATPQEVDEVEKWYAACEIDNSPLDSMSAKEEEALSDKIRNRILVPNEAFQASFIIHRSWMWGARVAATIAVILLAGWVVMKYRAGSSQQLTYFNKLKVPQLVTLTDSSVVWLHPRATLTLARDFGDKTRSLTLSGIAFFQVKRDTHRPFIIHTNEVFTQVLGTSFTIDATSSNQQVDVAVLSGSVKVQKEHSKEHVILLPTQKVRYTHKRREFHASLTPKDDISAVWRPESIEFDNTPLLKITQVLSKRFGVRIDVQDAGLYTCQLTANFTGQNLPAMLEMVSKSLALTYELDQNKIVLRGKGCTL